MSLFGGISNFVNPTNLAMAAMGPAGWAGIAAKTLMSSVGQQLIQQLGKELGLPQSAIDLAQGAFSAGMGDYQGAASSISDAVGQIAQQTGASSTEAGEGTRTIEDAVQQVVNDQSQSSDMKEAKASGGKGNQAGATSWLMAIAQTLGDKLNDMAHELTGMAQDAADDPSKGTLFAAKSQEFSILMNAANTGIKSIGDSLSTMARKD